MPRPVKHDLSAHQADITRMYGSEDYTREYIITWLAERDPPITCSLQTLSRQLRKWGVNKGLSAPLTEAQRGVAINFIKENWLNDVETAEILSERLETPISKWQIERLRHQNHLKMRYNDPVEREDPEGEEEEQRRRQEQQQRQGQAQAQRQRQRQRQEAPIPHQQPMTMDLPLDPRLGYRPALPWPANVPFPAQATIPSPAPLPTPPTPIHRTAPSGPPPPPTPAPLPSTLPIQRPPPFSFHPTHPSSPSHYPPNATALLLIDYQPLVLNSLPPSPHSTSPTPLQIATSLRTWAHTHNILTIHSLLNLSAPPYAPRPPETSRLASRWNKLVSLARETPSLAHEAPTLKQHHPGLIHSSGNTQAYNTGASLSVYRDPCLLSALTTPLVLQTLASHGTKSLILAGLPTSGPLLSTARHAHDLGFVVTVISDACADPNPQIHEVLMKEVLYATAHVVGSETAMGSLERCWRGEEVGERVKRKEKEERARLRKAAERRGRLLRLSRRRGAARGAGGREGEEDGGGEG